MCGKAAPFRERLFKSFEARPPRKPEGIASEWIKGMVRRKGWAFPHIRRQSRQGTLAAIEIFMQLQKLNRLSGIALLSTAVFAVSFQTAIAQVAPGDFSKLSARPARDWVRDGVIYEIYPRRRKKGRLEVLTLSVTITRSILTMARGKI